MPDPAELPLADTLLPLLLDELLLPLLLLLAGRGGSSPYFLKWVRQSEQRRSLSFGPEYWQSLESGRGRIL